MARIDSRGVVDDGSSSLTVSGGTTLSGALTVGGTVSGVSPGKMPAAALANTATTLSTPGYYTYTGGTNGTASACTGTLPSAADHAGAMFVFGPVAAGVGGMLLTGSAVEEPYVFAPSSASVIDGSRVTLAASSSLALLSDGRRWMQFASSGSLTFAR